MSELTTSLSKAIREWLAKRDNRNLSMLARLSGVSYPTIRRLAANESEPSAENAAAIAGIVLPKNEAAALIGRYFPGLKKLIFEINFETAYDEALKDFMLSRQHFQVILLADSIEGTNHDEVEKKFGEAGVRALREIIAADLLKKVDNRFYLNEDIGDASKAMARRYLSYLIEMCRPENDHIPSASGAYIAAKSLSPEAIERIHRKAADFAQWLFEHVNDPKNQGDVYWFGGWLHNILKNEDRLL
jgi:transcriptional regulator with XRE-family HTH domain